MRACVNPAHLFLGTPQENVLDAVTKGRHPMPQSKIGEAHRSALLTEDAVRRIRALAPTQSPPALAAMFGVRREVIYDVLKGRTWNHVLDLPDEPATPEKETSRRKRTTAPSERGGAFIGKRGTLSERFWRYVEKGAPDACWLWKGNRNNSGYGLIGLGGVGRMGTAHRVSWELHTGKIPPGAVICHRCDTPHCVNPAHLFLGSRRDSVLAAVRKGRHQMPQSQRGAAHTSSLLTEDAVRRIRALAPTQSPPALAAMFGVRREVIYDVLKGRTWKHVLDIPELFDVGAPVDGPQQPAPTPPPPRLPAHRRSRPFDPTKAPAAPARGVNKATTEEVAQMREKANATHHAILVALDKSLRAAGWSVLGEIPGAIDLWAERDGRRVIFEAKGLTLRTQVHQTRAAFAQLVEYRHFYGTPADALCVVTNIPLSDARARFIEAQGVAVAFLEGGRFYLGGPVSREVLGSFA